MTMAAMFTFLAKNCMISTIIEFFSNALTAFQILFETLCVIKLSLKFQVDETEVALWLI
jgi:hypothetical protein